MGRFSAPAGLGNSAADYKDLSAALEGRGLTVRTAGVSRLDWARNASGLRYREYWTGNLSPRPTVDWYLERVERAVDDAKRSSGGAPVTLLAHSAGGWLGRVYMKDFGVAGIDRWVPPRPSVLSSLSESLPCAPPPQVCVAGVPPSGSTQGHSRRYRPDPRNPGLLQQGAARLLPWQRPLRHSCRQVCLWCGPGQRVRLSPAKGCRSRLPADVRHGSFSPAKKRDSDNDWW